MRSTLRLQRRGSGFETGRAERPRGHHRFHCADARCQDCAGFCCRPQPKRKRDETPRQPLSIPSSQVLPRSSSPGADAPSSDPTARDFVPGPFSFPRMKHTYDSTIAPDLLTLTYTHVPPGTVPVESQKGTLREWDDSSPYHKNRPRRGPRGGGSSRLGILERKITWNNIPEIEAVTINSYAPLAADNKEYLHVARAVVQAISGAYPEVTTVKHHVIQWGVRKGDKAGAKVTLRGGAAYDFVDKLVTLVLPKIKDWPGIKATTGDDAGNLAFGMKPAWMAYFPEIEFNYDMYPAKLMPGCDIFIHTTGTSDRQGRLLMEALGFPFYGKVTH
ncbi:hypothetical protein ACCO45_008223 [Purpureocillium lilacinum]|uniref:Uncharacterized protein n=1 Tax=Purpureocillium lilacinum TaxID=33203 RepID=A0ACC4DMN6_PURLI